ncbi:binding-protein-dependent transport systems inner membrane component [Anaeromyxobacter dehalogenans 2CP-1]|uniref:Binding-protein-dependent transport systems inner membrane component n=1 Tax=Anaeromyxobacter dehalogenans (strain ATCC BAA-258 / DSM 21875 / 2CP-1) TaxID=455488 RepID=B8JBJ7_ANAD2|nr:sugar ABC transporter permease [Anaeromyxobacter dehalogenans]ACL67605.1 binding-protein-dependent transport systems inner membrane component [Anaeromyxobacter dehalogenans 2CP-1]
MTRPVSHWPRALAALAAGLAVAVALSWAWLRAASAGGYEERARAEAVGAVTQLAKAVEQAGGEGDAARAALSAWQAGQPAGTVARLVIVSGARLEGSTDPRDVGERAAPRRLQRDEKWAYDQAQRLRGVVMENAEQGFARAEVEVERLQGRYALGAPVRKDGAVVGAVEVDRPAKPPPAAPGVPAALAAVALPLLVLLPLRRAVARSGPALAAALVLYAAGVGGFAAWALRLAGGGGEGVRALGLSAAVGLALLLFVALGAASRTGAALRRHRVAYAYAVPAMIGMLVLVFFPFLYGVVLSFTGQTIYNTSAPLTELWVGLQNYVDILRTFAFRMPDGSPSFYWTLAFNVIWTVTNVAIGVSLGLVLALILNTRGLAFRPIYRVLLILPWAMPNYITALIWRGMFHRQFGVVNYGRMLFGLDPISWFDHPFTSYLTALATNGWLSFPFMMVVSLGALQSIPADLYEAARVDGATRWQQFKAITLPSLKPALVPAVILSVVWTFNMFNIIFLVTAGEPNGTTEILITQAYKYAFQQYRYGYAAAYSTVIFLILLAYGVFQNRVTRATEGI